MSAQHTRHRGEHIDAWLNPGINLLVDPPRRPDPTLFAADHGRHRADPDPPQATLARRILPIATAVIVAACGWTGFIIQTVRLHQADTDVVTVTNQLTQLTSQVQRACVNTVAPLDLPDWIPVCRVVQPEDLDR